MKYVIYILGAVVIYRVLLQVLYGVSFTDFTTWVPGSPRTGGSQ